MSIKKFVFSVVMLLLPFMSQPVFSEEELPKIEGEVKRVKLSSGKMTIRHEPIPNLNMPAMTMVFRTDENTDVSQYKKGDKVVFTVVEKDGKMIIVGIEKSE